MNGSGNPRQLRFGVLWDGSRLAQWESLCLAKLSQLTNPPELALVIVDKSSEERSTLPPQRRSFAERVRRAEWSRALYTRYCRYLLRPNAMADTGAAGTFFAGVPRLSCRTTRKGKWSEYFAAADVAKIRAFDLDFILRFGFEVIRGDILEAARFGVWSFHHDDERKYRGSPPCFWEIFQDDPVTGSVLQRLTDRLDGGVILKRGTFKTVQYSPSENLDQALLESAKWPALVCEDIRQGAAPYFDAPPSPSTASIRRQPTNGQLLRFGARVLRNKLRQRVSDAVLTEKWSLGIVRAPIHRFLDPAFRPEIQYLRGDGRSFLADPFGFESETGLDIVCEEYDYTSGKGALSTVRWDPAKGTTEKRPSDLASEHHLSYPFLLHHEGKHYCIPESHETREIALYEAQAFPDRWSKVATLIEGVAAVDATIFRHEGRWWCTATDADEGANRALFLWYADELRGPWRPHRARSVKTDIRSARPAGTPFTVDGRLYRPAQDCSRTYGGSIVIHRVDELSPTAFREEPVATVGPIKGTPFHDGVHTLSAAGNWTLLDGKRHGFNWRSSLARMSGQRARVTDDEQESHSRP